jgi:hypothetical protein
MSRAALKECAPWWPCQPVDQPVDRTSFPGLAPVSSPFSKIGVPEQIVMS